MKRSFKPTVILAWLVILGIAGTIVVSTAINKPRLDAAKSQREAQRMSFNFLGRYLIGCKPFTQPEQRAGLLKQIDQAATDDELRVKAAIVAGELAGKDEALSRLDDIDTDDARTFEAFYQNTTPLPDAMQKQYGFYARVALVNGLPETDPRHQALESTALKTVVVLLLGVVIAVLGGLLALGFLITAIVLMALGKTRPTLPAPVGNPDAYIEGFALYMSLYLGTSWVVGRFLPGLPLAFRLGLITLAVLVGAAWPLFRPRARTPWSAYRQDVGLHFGRNPIIEMLLGVAGYLAGIPLVIVAVAFSTRLAKWANFDMSHPISSEVTHHALAVAILACVFAPLSEEFFFRGQLLSHMRSRLGPWITAILTGTLFAAIHPQGWPAIPVLGAMGFNFAVIRQWRGTLISSITAHALNNGTVLLVAYVFFSMQD